MRQPKVGDVVLIVRCARLNLRGELATVNKLPGGEPGTQALYGVQLFTDAGLEEEKLARSDFILRK